MRFSALHVVIISVMTAHSLCIIPCFFGTHQTKTIRTPIAVRTIKHSAPTTQKAVNQTPSKKPVAKATTTSQKVATKVSAQKSVKKKETKTIPVKPQPVKKAVKEQTTQLDIPILSASPKVQDAKEPEKIDTTIDSLLLELQNLLELPKKGEVKVQLSISKNGKIESVVILNNEDEEMKAYLLGKLLNTQLLLTENLQKELDVTVLFKGF